MGIDLEKRDLIILSHGHFDHGNGLAHLSGGRLLCHPDCFVKRYRTIDHTYIGLKNSRSEIADRFDLTTSKAPFCVSDTVLFLGEIPRITDFESQQTAFSFEDGTPDFVADDSAVALQTEKGYLSSPVADMPGWSTPWNMQEKQPVNRGFTASWADFI